MSSSPPGLIPPELPPTLPRPLLRLLRLRLLPEVPTLKVPQLTCDCLECVTMGWACPYLARRV
jgi:hypothetical protein